MMDKREKLLRSIYEKKRLFSALNIFSSLISVLTALVFIALNVFLLVTGEHFEVLRIALAAGVPFFGVGLMRRLINAKRPYELYTFYGEKPKRALFGFIKKDKSEGGASFPSRHAYSAFVIATIIFFISPWQGAVLALLGALMCCARVLLGVHFVRDVLCGAAIGVVAGVLGELLLKF